VEAKAKEEAERQREVEEEERKKRTMEYLQRLRDEVLEEEAALLEGAEGSQIAGSKRKEVAAEDEEQKWGLEEESGKEENGDDIEGSKDGPRESQEEGTPPSTSY